MSRNSGLLALCVAAGLTSGCADYLNRYDTVTLHAGDAHAYNMLLQTKDPFNADSFDRSIPTDGQRGADAVRKYRTSQQPGAAPPQNITLNIN